MTRFAYVCKFCIYAKFAYVRKSGQICIRMQKFCIYAKFEYVCKSGQICIRMQKFCIYAKFAYVRKSGHVYAFTHICKICTYAKVRKFAPASDQVQISFCVYAKFAYMQIWSCEQKAKFANVSIYLIVLNNC